MLIPDSIRKIVFDASSGIVGRGNAAQIVDEVGRAFLALEDKSVVGKEWIISQSKKYAKQRLADVRALAFQKAKYIVSAIDAEEIAEQVVIKYFEQTDIADWKSWTAEAAKNAALNHKKSWHSRHRRLDEAEGDAALEDHTGEPDAALLDEETKRIIGETLEWLKKRNEEWYTVLCLVKFEDMSREECAKRIGRSPNSVKGILQRAMEAFAEELRKHREDLL